MWLLHRLVCLLREHVFAVVDVDSASYQYCLRCGAVTVPASERHHSIR